VAADTLTLKGLDQEAVTAWSRALGDPDWFRARRLEALAALGKLERPTGREEAWRFTDPKRAGLDRHQVLRSAGETSAGTRALAAGHGDAASGGDMAGTVLHPAGLVATVDGAAGEAFLDPDLAERGVILTDLATALREHAGLVEPRFMTAAAPFAEDWFLALHATLVTAGTFLYVPRGVEVTAPLGALHRRSGAGASFAHTLVVVEPEASLTLVQQHGSPEDLPGRAFHHGVTELLIGERAAVQYLSLQEWGSEQVNHFGVQRALVGRQARFRSFVVTLGGGVVRISPDTVLAEGAEADLLGAVFADAGQRFEHRATVTHAEPHARSSLLYKAGLLGGSRNIFNGNLIIRPGARDRPGRRPAPVLPGVAGHPAPHGPPAGGVRLLRGGPRPGDRAGGPPPPGGRPGGRAGRRRGAEGGGRGLMPFVRLAGLDELEVDQGHRVELGDEEAVALIRTGDGVYAVVDVCSHEDYPLSEGWVEDHTVECALHGSRFDLVTGNPDSPPALRPVQIFPVRVEGEDVLVDLPDDWAKLADEPY
jgi:Fe-S cluster assembly protein SufD